MRKIMVLVVALAAFAGVGVKAASAEMQSWYSQTLQTTLHQRCYYRAGADATGIGSVGIFGTYWGCDLWVADALMSPRVCVFSMDLNTGTVSRLACTKNEQNKVSDVASLHELCVPGDKIVVDAFVKNVENEESMGIASVQFVCPWKSPWPFRQGYLSGR